MSVFFNRNWAVSIGEPGQQGQKYDALRVLFDVDKNSESTPNKAKISLVNLSGDSRVAYERKGLQITLQAGYNDIFETLFIGDVADTKSKREGAAIVTTFECGDGERFLVNAHFEKSYPPGASDAQIVKDLASALGVSQSTIIGLQKKVYNKGITFTKSVRYALDKIIGDQGLEWSIQNGGLQIIPVTAHNGDPAEVVSRETGLIGVPTQGNGCVEFKSLLNPRLVPGSPVSIESKTINGLFKIRRSRFEGDSHGDKWFVTCEAVKIAGTKIVPTDLGNKFGTVA